MKNENLENAVESTEVVVEEVSNNSNIIKKVAVGLGVTGLIVAGVLYFRKKRNSKKEQVVVLDEATCEKIVDNK